MRDLALGKTFHTSGGRLPNSYEESPLLGDLCVCVCAKICSKDTGPAGSDKVKNSNNEELYVDGRFNHGIGYSNNSHDIYSSSNTAADFRAK